MAGIARFVGNGETEACTGGRDGGATTGALIAATVGGEGRDAAAGAIFGDAAATAGAAASKAFAVETGTVRTSR